MLKMMMRLLDTGKVQDTVNDADADDDNHAADDDAGCRNNGCVANWRKLLLTESACKPASCHLIHTASFDHCPMTIMTMAMFWIMLDRCIDADDIHN